MTILSPTEDVVIDWGDKKITILPSGVVLVSSENRPCWPDPFFVGDWFGGGVDVDVKRKGLLGTSVGG